MRQVPGRLPGARHWRSPHALPTRGVLGFVVVANVVTVVATLVWLVWKGFEMSGAGLAVVGVLGIIVLRFAVYQSAELRK